LHITHILVGLFHPAVYFLKTAIGFYRPEGSKYNTFFDAIVAAVTKLTKADAIFSFDEWYKKQGFKITDEFMKENK